MSNNMHTPRARFDAQQGYQANDVFDQDQDTGLMAAITQRRVDLRAR
jgi:hypothetical protein